MMGLVGSLESFCEVVLRRLEAPARLQGYSNIEFLLGRFEEVRSLLCALVFECMKRSCQAGP